MSLRPWAVTAVAALALAGRAAALAAQPQNITITLGVAQSGVVQSIDIKDGAYVEAGQVLVELDCAPLRKEIDVRTAALEAAEAVYERVVHGPRPEEIAIGEAGSAWPRRARKKARRSSAPTRWRLAWPSPARSCWLSSATPGSPMPNSSTRARSSRS